MPWMRRLEDPAGAEGSFVRIERERNPVFFMKMIADLHLHTVASNHAFNTVTEMARRAQELGFFAAAVTDHAPRLPDSPHPWYFSSLKRLPDRIEGIWLLKGVEANVLSLQGELDFTPADFERMQLDWVIASIHSDAFCRSLTEDDATRLWLNIAENSYVDCIGHSESRAFCYDYDTVTKVFAQKHKIVEMNGNSAVARPGNEENLRALALACKRNGTSIAVNSDAHSIYRLGCFDSVLPMLEEIDFPMELIVNASKENLIAALREHQKPVAYRMEERIVK